MWFTFLYFFTGINSTKIILQSKLLNSTYFNLNKSIGSVFKSHELTDSWILAITDNDFLETFKEDRFLLEDTIFGTRFRNKSQCLTAKTTEIVLSKCIDDTNLDALTQRFDIKAFEQIKFTKELKEEFHPPVGVKSKSFPWIDPRERISTLEESHKKRSSLKRMDLTRQNTDEDDFLRLDSKDHEMEEPIKKFISK